MSVATISAELRASAITSCSTTTGADTYIRPVTTTPTPGGIQPPSLVEKFRAGSQQRLPLHPAEKKLLGLLIAHLGLLPWAIGTMYIWTQIASLVLAVIGFGMALWPRDYTARFTGGPEFKMAPWPKLLRFPLFWFGLALLAYIAIQGLNPAWRYESNPSHWWLRRVKHIAWLPSGMETPFARFNAWRALIIYSSAWLVACSIWVGLTRRLSVQYLLMGLAINGCVLAVIAAAQRFAGNGKILWFVTPPVNSMGFASFIYKNHAGAYLGLIAAISLGLAYWYYDRGVRRLQKSNPAGLFAFMGLFVALMVIFSFSRAAAVLILVYLAAAGVALFFIRRRQAPGTGSPVIALTLLLVFAGFAYVALQSFEIDQVVRRFDEFGQEGLNAPSVIEREMARTAGEDMLQANWLTGTGAGSFRFYYPEYVKKFPQIYRSGKSFWEHAHCDWLEIPIELGLGGMLLLLGCAGSIGLILIRNYAWSSPLAVLLLLGCAMTLAHAWVDFPFQCPAILITWTTLPVCVARWLELENQSEGR